MCIITKYYDTNNISISYLQFFILYITFYKCTVVCKSTAHAEWGEP